MPLAKLTLTVPDEIWISEVSTVYSDAIFRVISTQHDDGTATGLVEIEGGDIVQILSRANDDLNVMDIELLWKNNKKAIIQIETDNPLLLFPASRAGVPLKTPFVISDGRASWEIVTSYEKFSELTDMLDIFDIAYTLKSVQEFDHEREETILTDRQREVIQTALESGYYDTPRGASQTEVAEIVDITKATCSDILHRAEGKIVKQYLD